MSEWQHWPDTLWIVRHGQSAGNVAREAAEAAGMPTIDIATRDVDVPLSPLGEQQATALGCWFGKLPPEQRPTVVLTSSYRRARDTATLAIQAAGLSEADLHRVVDERLREREFGILDRLTIMGIQQKFPDQAEFCRVLGKFYFRPPGGESWCDVILRLRSVLDTLSREYRRERVLIVAHQVSIYCFRYLFEHLNEEEILAIDRETDIANCAITSYVYDAALGKHGRLVLHHFNEVAPLAEAGAPITHKPDVPVAPK